MKYLLVTLLSMILFIPVGTVLAEEVNTTRPTTTKQSTTREENKQKAEEKKIRLEEKRQAEAAKRGDSLQKHCDEVIKNISTLLDKVKLRRDDWSSKGKDTSTLDKVITEVETALSKAGNYCSEAVTKYNSVPVGEIGAQRAVLLEGRRLAEQARLELVKAHKGVAKALYELTRIKRNSLLKESGTK